MEQMTKFYQPSTSELYGNVPMTRTTFACACRRTIFYRHVEKIVAANSLPEEKILWDSSCPNGVSHKVASFPPLLLPPTPRLDSCSGPVYPYTSISFFMQFISQLQQALDN